jgi:hypothetical protein
MSRHDDKPKEQTSNTESGAVSTPPPLPRVAPGTPGKAEFIVRPSEPDRIAFGATVSTPRKNEEGVLDVCQRLIDHLNTTAAKWSNPTIPSSPEEGIDAVSNSSNGWLKLQVTRALADREFWSTLAEHKAVTAYTTREEAAENLWRSIARKATSIPPASRSEITLVLDASETFAHHSRDVVGLFRSRYGEQAKALGFSAIWLVGAHRMFVLQIA